MKALRDIFFYYPVNDSGNLLEASLTTTDIQNESHLEKRPKFRKIRESALAEIRYLEVLLSDDIHDPEYICVYRDFFTRLRTIGYPDRLSSEEGIRDYYDYLMRIVRPTVQELVHSGKKI